MERLPWRIFTNIFYIVYKLYFVHPRNQFKKHAHKYVQCLNSNPIDIYFAIEGDIKEIFNEIFNETVFEGDIKEIFKEIFNETVFEGDIKD